MIVFIAIRIFLVEQDAITKVTSCVCTALPQMCISHLQEEKGHTWNKQLVIVFLFCVLNHITVFSVLV